MRRVSTVVLGATIVGLTLCVVWLALEPRNALAPFDAFLDVTVLAVASVAFAIAGSLIVRRANNRTGLVFSFAGLGGSFLAWTDILVKSTPTPHPMWVSWVGLLSLVGQMLAVGALTILFLIFPTGTLPGPRWRWAGWLWALGLVAVATATLLRAGPMNLNVGGIVNPIGIRPLDRALNVEAPIGGAALLASVVTGLVALVVRSRRGGPEERVQIRWLAYVGGLALALFVISGIGEAVTGSQDSFASSAGWLGFILCLVVGIPAAVAIAILRYRLYEIDVVIRKTVVFGVLGAFITLVYVVIVQGLGSLFSETLFLRIAATAFVAVAFQPVRDRANRFANRLVYGDRATPYEILARFGERVGETYANDDVLQRIARVIAEGTAAARSEVWLRLGDRLTPAASWPISEPQGSFAIEGDELPAIDADRVAPVRHQGELLGAIAVTKPASEPLAPGEAELLDRLAEQAGLVLANARLTTDLEARLAQIAGQAADLRASRQRIVAAQDEERRKLERNIHDGAQQHLVALAVKLRLTQSTLEKDPQRGQAMLADIGGEVDAALDTLRSLALGIYPPLLEQQGIAAALAVQYARGSLPVRMETDGIGRYPIEIEAAVYFCALEALQNAAKYANASTITIAFREREGALEFSVTDDGVGFDAGTNGGGTGIQGMRDRISVLGGDAAIESSPGTGTTVRGRVPISERVPT